jgi:RNA polymerase sigma factor (sigma-70 family)
MAELSQGDRYLLDQIRQGDTDAWSQLVDRYRGRLLAFARSRLRGSHAEAEDLLQDCFVNFLRGLPNFRGEASLETYLFTILRRRIIDWYRGRNSSICLLEDVYRTPSPEDSSGMGNIAGTDPSASFYARRDEQSDLQREALAAAVTDLIDTYKQQLQFRELKVIDLVFYAHLANREVGEVTGVEARTVATIKHRCLQRLKEKVDRELRSRGLRQLSGELAAEGETLLTQVWEDLRPSCPKRNTIGAHVLGTLEDDWNDYVAFHLNKLGCRFCLANLQDLQQKTADDSGDQVRDRILQSTIGFLRKA